MAFEIMTIDQIDSNAEVIGVPFFAGPGFAEPVLAREATQDEETFGLDTSFLNAQGFLGTQGFVGKVGESFVLPREAQTVVALGLGERSELTADVVRRAAAIFIRKTSKAKRAVLVGLAQVATAEMDGDVVAQAIAEGLVLGSYRFNEYKSNEQVSELVSVAVVGADRAGLERGGQIAGAVVLARDLINQPPSVMTPRRFAGIATDVAQAAGLGIAVWDEDVIERERLGGLLGVSLGSAEPPRLVTLTYLPPVDDSPLDDPPGAAQDIFHIALVGKGITFDSGGLSLKPPDSMIGMKTDMSGAAAVLGAMSVLGALRVPIKVTGIMCLSENLPGPRAVKPGDVLRARNGKTMEVLNTDAEGRLVLADGLCLAVEAGVSAVVDVATLTGACIVALGNEVGGLMGNDDSLISHIRDAAQRSGEDVWPLPLPKKYRKHIDSEIADIKNIGAGKGAAGALSAGLFLQEFVGDTPWVHLDIAGPARSDSDDAYITKGATGFATRTLIEAVRTFDSGE